MENELCVTSHVYLLKGNPPMTEVGTAAWPLVQIGWLWPREGQSPQYKPGPQSEAAAQASRTWQPPLEQAEELAMKNGKIKRTQKE